MTKQLKIIFALSCAFFLLLGYLGGIGVATFATTKRIGRAVEVTPTLFAAGLPVTYRLFVPAGAEWYQMTQVSPTKHSKPWRIETGGGSINKDTTEIELRISSNEASKVEGQ